MRVHMNRDIRIFGADTSNEPVSRASKTSLRVSPEDIEDSQLGGLGFE
jgi:hypothetical protein